MQLGEKHRGTIAHMYALHFRTRIRSLVMLVWFWNRFEEENMQNQDFCQELKGHIRLAQVMKVQGGPPTKIWKQMTQCFACAPHIYIFQGWYKQAGTELGQA